MGKSIGTATLLGVVCLALMPTAPAYAANWVYVTISDSNAVWYYDSDTIQRSGNQVSVWLKIDHSRDKTVKHRESRGRYRFDCEMTTNTLLQMTDYYRDGKIETVIYKTYQQEEQAIAPDTVAEEMFEAVCRQN